MPVKKGYGIYQEYKCENCGKTFDCTLGWGVSRLGTPGTDFCSNRCYREFDDERMRKIRKGNSSPEIVKSSEIDTSNVNISESNTVNGEGCSKTIGGIALILVGVIFVWMTFVMEGDKVTFGSRAVALGGGILFLFFGYKLIRNIYG
jgi:hypothetical protein